MARFVKLVCVFVVVIYSASCATLRYENNVEIFLAPSHKPAPKIADPRLNVFQFIDNDRNAYLTRWAVKSNTAKAFSAAKLDCLEAQADTLTAQAQKPISQIDPATLAPDNYKALVKCVYDSGYNLVGRDSFFPDGFTLNFARMQASKKDAYSALGKRYLVKKSGVDFKTLLSDALECKNAASANVAADPTSEKNWEDNYARPYKEAFINCLVSREYRVWQN